MSVLVASLVVHIVSLVFSYLLVVPAAAHRLANVTYPRHISAFAAAVHTQSGTEHGLTHSHTYSITVVAGAVLSLVFLYPARALRRAAESNQV
ncbi:hypothetical protein C8R43DRAFT_1119448 [Mycena crocata]|nr:hypothetical protein C8R43DRAFT_1119445 [Mycena crocata]KAJ7174061.1 hypothetical protein C8R43DRAFT_1119448 [Mycena crocata]